MVISEQNLIFISGPCHRCFASIFVEPDNQQPKKVAADTLTARLDQDVSTLRETLAQRENEVASLNRDKASLETRLEGERTRYEEQLQLLRQARESLTQEFENLANRIFDAKQENSLSRVNRLSISPLTLCVRKLPISVKK